MEKEHKRELPKGARYPLFILGLAIIIIGGVTAQLLGASTSVELGLVIAGFICLLLSVVPR